MSQGFTRAGFFVEAINDQGSPAPLVSGWPVKITNENGDFVLGTPLHPLAVSGVVSVSGVSVVTITSLPSPLTVNGAVAISGGLPNITISSMPSPITVNGAVAISGIPTVSVTNFPATQNVNIVGATELDVNNIDGSVNISGWFGSIAPTVGQKTTSASLPVVIASDQSSVPIQGTVNISGIPTVSVISMPNPVTVNGAVAISGIPTVNINNFPNPISVDGVVAISGQLPNVTVISMPNPVTVNGAVAISGIPTVAFNNFPSPITVNGAVSVSGMLPTGTNTIGAITGIDPDNSTNSILKLPTLSARANAAAPTWTEGNQTPLSVDLAGNQRISIRDPLGAAGVKVTIFSNAGADITGTSTSTDAVSVTGTALETAGFLYAYDPKTDTYGRVRSTANEDILISAARTTTTTTSDFTNIGAAGGIFIFDITAVPGAQTVTFSVQGKDATSSKYYTILTGAAESATVTRRYKIYPTIIGIFQTNSQDLLPRTFRVVITHSAGGSFTYSVGVCYMP